MIPVAMTIAGSDPSGGAGLQADLKVFQQWDVFGTAVVTLLTVQNTVGVRQVQTCSANFVAAQLDAVLEDIPPAAAKTGALGSSEIVNLVAERAGEFSFPLVVDPVVVSKSRDRLIDDDGLEAVRRRLLPAALIATPNAYEAEALTGIAVVDEPSMIRAAEAIAELGPRYVLLKGPEIADDAPDVLFGEGCCRFFRAERIRTPHTHGSGCAFSAAIAAGLARGMPVPDAVQAAKEFVTEAIRQAPGLGKGRGPLDLNLRPTRRSAE
ncbi:bifunctional hydroxymethylpyrimidine kinase/phosphomethylpyrimidine kinase [Thermopirellula anaerolimosa]